MDPNHTSERENAGPVPVVNGMNNYGTAYPPPMQSPYPQPNIAMAYSQPVPAAIVINQVAPVITVTAHTSSPYATTCQFCKNPITTTPITTCNCLACLLCWWTGLIFFCCFQLCRGKDVCCFDATHKCPICGNTVSFYTAC